MSNGEIGMFGEAIRQCPSCNACPKGKGEDNERDWTMKGKEQRESEAQAIRTSRLKTRVGNNNAISN